MRFEASEEHRHFAESVRTALVGWEPPREPDLGRWSDDRDDALERRLAKIGWSDLAADASLLGAAVAGGIELGRACAPACLLDEPTLGAPLVLGDRARHASGVSALAVASAGGGLARGVVVGDPVPERTLDGSGTVRVAIELRGELPAAEASACWAAWNAVTLAYLAGLADRSLELAVEHVRGREQFGAPLGELPAVRARLADAALAVDGVTLLAWQAASEPGPGIAERAWAGAACCEVTAAAHQVHGAVGFALETGLHRWYRRARSVHAWSAAASFELR